MSFITLQARCDRKQIPLDEPFDLAPKTQLIAALHLPDSAEAVERAEWFAFATTAFAPANGDDEPDYSDAIIRERPAK